MREFQAHQFAGQVTLNGESRADIVNTPERHTQINNLAVNLLAVRNPGVPQADIEAAFRSRTDVLSDTPLVDVLRVPQPEGTTLKSLDDAIRVARFYSDHETTQVPDKVVVQSRGAYYPVLTDGKDEKALVFLEGDEEVSDDVVYHYRTEGITSNSRRVLQQLPDVYVSSFPTRKKFDMGAVESVALVGADNLIISDTAQVPESIKVDLACEGDFALMPDGKIPHDAERFSGLSGNNISVKAAGAITRYSGTELRIGRLESSNMDQLGGSIDISSASRSSGDVSPEPQVTTTETIVDKAVGGSSENIIIERSSGGTVEPSHISEADLLARETEGSVYAAEGNGGLEERPTSMQEHSEQFDAMWTPDAREVAKDSGMEVRGYVTTELSEKDAVALAVKAVVAGWEPVPAIPNVLVIRRNQDPHNDRR